MPIEINQLHINIQVSDEEKSEPNNKDSMKKEREGIVAASVEAVLDILERKKIR